MREKESEMKPWKREIEEPVCEKQMPYVWRTSIPQSWVRLKGESYFQAVGDQTHRGSDLDFLRRTQQYLAKPPSFRSLHHTDRGSRDKPQLFTDKDCNAVGHDTGTFPQPRLRIAATIRSLQKKVARAKPPLPKAPSTYRITTMTLDPLQTTDRNGYVVHKYSLPKALIPVQKEKSPAKTTVFPPRVDSYLSRFDLTQIPQRPSPSRKGVTGWKLHKARSAVSTLSPVRSTSMLRKLPAGEGKCWNSPEEPYLEYLRWRRCESQERQSED